MKLSGWVLLYVQTFNNGLIQEIFREGGIKFKLERHLHVDSLIGVELYRFVVLLRLLTETESQRFFIVSFEFSQRKMYLIILFYLLSVIDADRLPFGHLKPFGSTDSPLTVREFSNEFPTALTFVDEHLEKSVPFLVRHVLNENLHFEMWRTDQTIENEINDFNDDEVFVQSSRDPERIQMNFRDFLKRYIGENLFLVDNLPTKLQ